MKVEAESKFQEGDWVYEIGNNYGNEGHLVFHVMGIRFDGIRFEIQIYPSDFNKSPSWKPESNYAMALVSLIPASEFP